MIFKEIRSKPYESLGFYFTDKALQFEAATDKNQNKSTDLKELQESVQKIKALNIPVAKPLCDIHNNICYYMKKQNVVLNTKQCHNLEQLINHAENPKEIVSLLETKMVKQTRIETILRLMCLFSVTQSGLKQEQFDHLRRVFLMCYGY